MRLQFTGSLPSASFRLSTAFLTGSEARNQGRGLSVEILALLTILALIAPSLIAQSLVSGDKLTLAPRIAPALSASVYERYHKKDLLFHEDENVSAILERRFAPSRQRT